MDVTFKRHSFVYLVSKTYVDDVLQQKIFIVKWCYSYIFQRSVLRFIVNYGVGKTNFFGYILVV